MNLETCSECVYMFKKLSACKDYECRRHAPVATEGGRWPYVRTYEWCGDFIRSEETTHETQILR